MTQNGKTVVYPATALDGVEPDPGCTFCALNASLSQALANYVGELVPGIVVMVTGSPARPDHLDRVLRAVEDTPVQVFPILLSATAHPDLMKLAAAGGGVSYAVPEGGSALSPQVNYSLVLQRSCLQAYFLNISFDLSSLETLIFEEIHQFFFNFL